MEKHTEECQHPPERYYCVPYYGPNHRGSRLIPRMVILCLACHEEVADVPLKGSRRQYASL